MKLLTGARLSSQVLILSADGICNDGVLEIIIISICIFSQVPLQALFGSLLSTIAQAFPLYCFASGSPDSDSCFENELITLSGIPLRLVTSNF